MAKKRYIWLSQIPGYEPVVSDCEESDGCYINHNEILFVWDYLGSGEIIAIDVGVGKSMYRHNEMIPVAFYGSQDDSCPDRSIGTNEYFKFYRQGWTVTCEVLQEMYDTFDDDSEDDSDEVKYLPVKVLNPVEWPWAEVDL